ncbi:MAG: hypothetical protein LIO41_03435 [Ruminococcus sp.]|nr:hypothetical protein [Ruminococcus sp.]
MTKVCKSCGKEYTGDYCEHCGYGNPDLKIKSAEKYKQTQKPLKVMTDEERTEYSKEQKEKRAGKKLPKKATKILSCIVGVLIVAAIVLFVLYRQGYIFNSVQKEDVAEKYFDSINSRSFSDFLSCVPPAVKEVYEDEAEELGLDDSNALDTLYSDMIEMYGDDFEIDTTLGKAKTVDDDAIEDYEDEYKEYYDKSISVSQAYVISATATISGSLASDEVYYEIYTAKIGGKWYVVNVSQITPTVTE